MTNFDYLKQEPKFNDFSDVAIVAERVLQMDKESSVINCRRAMEYAIKWMYSVDKSLEMPYQDNLISLMSTEDFYDLVDDGLSVITDIKDVISLGREMACDAV